MIIQVPRNKGALISISGAQSTGKTTIINELERMGYSVKTEITRSVLNKGFKINEEGGDETQRLIIQEHKNRLAALTESDDVTILDRGILDGVVYTHYLFNINQVSLETLEYAQKIFKECINKYDVIFYIPPEFDIEADGTRSTNKEFRDSIVKLFEEYIKEYNIDVVLLKGSAQERVNEVLSTLQVLQVLQVQ